MPTVTVVRDQLMAALGQNYSVSPNSHCPIFVNHHPIDNGSYSWEFFELREQCGLNSIHKVRTEELPQQVAQTE